MPLNALLGIDQFIKAKYLLKKINVYNVEMNGVVKPLMLTLHWIFRIDQNLTTLKLKKILSLIVYTSLSERNNMRFSSSIFKKLGSINCYVVHAHSLDLFENRRKL